MLFIHERNIVLGLLGHLCRGIFIVITACVCVCVSVSVGQQQMLRGNLSKMSNMLSNVDFLKVNFGQYFLQR